jgi:hypothetical protein
MATVLADTADVCSRMDYEFRLSSRKEILNGWAIKQIHLLPRWGKHFRASLHQFVHDV